MKKRTAPLKKDRSGAKKRKASMGQKRIYRGALGAGTMYAVVALLIIALGASLMIGNIVPLTSTSPINGQPVIISPPNLEKEKSNLQLFSFPGVTYTPTPVPTIPPQPQEDWGNGGSSGNKNGGNNNNPGSCFVAGTKILMADMSEKNIEKVRAGDRIMSFNGHGLSKETVTAVESPIRDHHYNITLADKTVLGITDDHSIFTENGWKAIDPEHAKRESPNIAINKLNVGDSALKSTGELVRIVSIVYYPGNVQTYNLKGVTGYNNYYANDVVAHNKGDSNGGGEGGGNGGHGIAR